MASTNLRFSATIILGAIGAALTALIFLAAVTEPTRGQWAGFAVLLGAEALVTIGLAWIERSSGHISGVMFRAGASVSFLAYLAASGLTALWYIFQAGETLKWLLTLEAVWLGLLAAVLTLLFASSASTAEADRELQALGARLRQMESRLAALAARASGETWGAALAQMAEDLKFVDHACSVPTDALIAEKITALEALLESPGSDPEEGSGGVLETVEELRRLIARRSGEASNVQRGGY